MPENGPLLVYWSPLRTLLPLYIKAGVPNPHWLTNLTVCDSALAPTVKKKDMAKAKTRESFMLTKRDGKEWDGSGGNAAGNRKKKINKDLLWSGTGVHKPNTAVSFLGICEQWCGYTRCDVHISAWVPTPGLPTHGVTSPRFWHRNRA